MTGIGQAVMGVREAIELFGKAVLLEDPETGELKENSREVLDRLILPAVLRGLYRARLVQ